MPRRGYRTTPQIKEDGIMSEKILNRILYVEDEPDIRAIAKLALEEVGGLPLTSAATGEEAVARAEAFAPDLILLDMMMPGMDGHATLRALRARGRSPRSR